MNKVKLSRTCLKLETLIESFLLVLLFKKLFLYDEKLTSLIFNNHMWHIMSKSSKLHFCIFTY